MDMPDIHWYYYHNPYGNFPQEHNSEYKQVVNSGAHVKLIGRKLCRFFFVKYRRHTEL